MNWTKTLALWILTAALSVLFALLCSDLLIPITCQSRQSVNVDQASKIPRSVVINGYVVSLDSIKADSIKQAISKYSGRDVSDMFPQFLSLSGSRANNGATFTDVDMQRCFGARKAQAFAWQEARMKSGGYSLQNKTLTQCPAPDGSKSQCFTLADDSDSITKAIVADISFKPDQLSVNDAKDGRSLVSINGRVYDIGDYLALTSRQKTPSTDFLPEDFSTIISQNIGKDVSDQVNGLPAGKQLQLCMDKLFYAGITQHAAIMRSCYVWNYPMIVIVIAAIVPLLIKITLDSVVCCGGGGNQDLTDSSGLVVIVPDCESVGTKQLLHFSNTLFSSTTADMTVVFVFNGTRMDSHQPLLKFLGWTGGMEVNTQRPTCFTGRFQGSTRFSVIVDCTLNANDSCLKCASNNLVLSALASQDGQYCSAFQREFLQSLGTVDFCYAAIVSPQLLLGKDSLSRLLSALQRDESMAGVSGQVRPRSAWQSFTSMLFSYSHYLTYDIAPRFESAFTSHVTSVPQFMAYRLRFRNNAPCLLDGEIVERLIMSPHKCLGSHCENNLNAYIIRRFPKMKIGHCRYAQALTTAYDQQGIGKSLADRIRLWRSTFLTRVSLLRTDTTGFGHLCAKLWLLCDLMSMLLLPVASICWYFCLNIFISNPDALSFMITFTVFPALVILHSLILASRLRFEFMLSVPLYLLIGVPIFITIIPLLALLTINSRAFVSRNKNTTKDDDKQLTCGQRAEPVKSMAHTFNRASSIMTAETNHNASRQATKYYQPTNFSENRTKPLVASGAPNRAASMARSDYSSEYAPSTVGNRQSAASKFTVQSRHFIKERDSTSLERVSGLSKDEVREEIRFFLQESDLNSVSRQDVQEHLFIQFGESVEVYNDFISNCMEEFTLEKLALK